MTPATDMFLILALPFCAAIGIWMFGKMEMIRESITFIFATLLAILVFGQFSSVLAGIYPRLEIASPIPGVPISFRLEPLGMIFAGVASLLWIVNSLFSIGYMRRNNEPRQTRFYVCFAIALGSTMGIALADNLLTLFVFYEALTLSTYPLVTHHKNNNSITAGRVYLGVLLSTSVLFFLTAIIATWVLVGDLSFRENGILTGRLEPITGSLLLFLFVLGIGKAAIMPFHKWLPAAMVAPTPVSALLHAVAVVKAGVFCVVKISVYIFGIDYLNTMMVSDVILYAACFTIVIASVIALKQDNLKRRLAYSTVSQLSYVVLGTFILAPVSTVGAVFHVAAHAFGKITLFMVAGAIYTTAHKTKVSELNGIGRRMPWTMAAFAIGSLSMIGIPPCAGFLSKWYMLLGALSVNHYIAIIVILSSTLLNAAYFLPIIHAAFLRAEEPGNPETQNANKLSTKFNHGEAALPILAAILITATITILLFFYPTPVLELAKQLTENR